MHYNWSYSFSFYSPFPFLPTLQLFYIFFFNCLLNFIHFCQRWDAFEWSTFWSKASLAWRHSTFCWFRSFLLVLQFWESQIRTINWVWNKFFSFFLIWTQSYWGIPVKKNRQTWLIKHFFFIFGIYNLEFGQ